MPQTCAVYGYAITKPIDLLGARLEPVMTDSNEAHKHARDQSRFNLTATLVGPHLEPLFLFNLEAVLSFVERLDVLITEPSSGGQTTFPTTLASHSRNSGGGKTILEDTVSPDSRADFVGRVMERLADKTFCERTGFNIFFFKYVEAFRQRKPFLEVTWFLLYSGLEAFARSELNDPSNKNSSVPISRLLKSYGFRVFQENPRDLVRSVSTYMHLRNALFHQGVHETLVKMNGSQVHLEMTRFLFNFEQLVALTILKVVGFDDHHVNWDSWVDRQPFK
jgi:hypothetical protein